MKNTYVWFLSLSAIGMSFNSFSKGTIQSSNSLCCAKMKSNSWSNCCCCCLIFSIPLFKFKIWKSKVVQSFFYFFGYKTFSPLAMTSRSQAFNCNAWFIKTFPCSSSSIVHLFKTSSSWLKFKAPERGCCVPDVGIGLKIPDFQKWNMVIFLYLQSCWSSC